MIAKDTTIQFRKSICNSCEFKEDVLVADVCGKYGCLLSVKTKFSNMYCPMNKWGKEDATGM